MAVAATALAATGCCGGYAIVRTNTFPNADFLGDRDGAVVRGRAWVLRFERTGEPAGSCESGAKYSETVLIRLPAVQEDTTYTIGAPGVRAQYSREQGGAEIEAVGIAGTVRVESARGAEVEADVDVTITLPSGEHVRVDDRYVFHPGE